MIKSFRDKGLEPFYPSGTKTGIRPAHAKKLRMPLAALDTAAEIGAIASGNPDCS